MSQSDEDLWFVPWRWWRRWLGQRSERAAARFLRRLGYKLIAANVRYPVGEIDLLALDGAVLVVVEVRSTSSVLPHALRETALSVDSRKQRKLVKATLAFLNRRKLLGKIPTRFDLIVVVWPPGVRRPEVHHYKNAFAANESFQFFS